jgi:hypothetical protein
MLLTKPILCDEGFRRAGGEHALHQSPKTINTDLSPPPISRSASSRSYGLPSPLSTSSSVSSSPSRENSSTSHTHLRPSSSSTNDSHIQRWHTNLETRLHPFWAGVLSNRAVRVSVRPHFDLTETEVEFCELKRAGYSRDNLLPRTRPRPTPTARSRFVF